MDRNLPTTGSDALLLEAYARTRGAVSNSSRSSRHNSSSDGSDRNAAAAAAAASPLPGPRKLSRARASLPKPDDPTGPLQARGFHGTLDHILTDIAPALTGQNRSSRYWGFVTGSTLPIAEAADNVVSAYDQNVQVHLPAQTIATEVEDVALRLLVRLLALGPPGQWAGRTLTTGATASNILGLACGREAVVAARLPPADQSVGVGELGLLRACLRARISDIRVLTSAGHSSLAKAASVVGLGRGAIRELPLSPAEPWRLDLDAVERELQCDGVASIIAVSAGEVNTGRFATDGLDDMRRLRQMADRHGAWIHVDGAFGIFARALPLTDEFSDLRRRAAGLELADSITIDGHKLLNVPYDTGIFFTRKASVLTSVCKNPNAAYLSAGAASEIESPLNVGLENSRRFRALPVYAVLLSEGAQGIAEMLASMVRLARGIATAVRALPDYELLPDPDASLADTHICVLFRAKDDALNETLVENINKTGQWYVSGTRWRGRPAVRVAIANWRVNVEEDARLVADSLARIAKEHRDGKM